MRAWVITTALGNCPDLTNQESLIAFVGLAAEDFKLLQYLTHLYLIKDGVAVWINVLQQWERPILYWPNLLEQTIWIQHLINNATAVVLEHYLNRQARSPPNFAGTMR